MKAALSVLLAAVATAATLPGAAKADDDWDDYRDARREYFERQREAEREYWEERREAAREYREDVRDWYRDRWDDRPRFRAYGVYNRPYGYSYHRPYGYGYPGAYPGYRYYQPRGAYFYYGW